jgi:23S rRNA (adenine2030-N6)-methyltransferase
MLSYQHIYHAGCFADVVKHLTLVNLLDYLTKKDAPMLYLDTHAGRGAYDLTDKLALKTGEANLGILPLWTKRAELPDVYKTYIKSLEQMNKGTELRYYPGSPALALELLRKQDRAVFCELHSGEQSHLRSSLPKKRVKKFIYHDDGLNILNALMPPIERRGLIFMDPAYELSSDYKNTADAITRAHKRFKTGVYCIWYPIIDERMHLPLTRGLEAIQDSPYLSLTFNLQKTQTIGMGACGLWIINPTYNLADIMHSVLQTLTTILNPGESSYKIFTHKV